MQDRKKDDTAANERTKKKKRRSAPLTGVSKLRKAANARERERVRVLNKGIELLKSILPIDESIVKPTKTDIIWMAARYIYELREMLHESYSGRSSSGSEEFEELSPISVGTAQECISDLSDLESLMNIDIDELVTFEKEHQIFFSADTYEF
ncbi:transcription factor 21-like [Actinia tenebrosa]|uniref:Transcription factor 21-like n=1 Tax=Actinia tenebrosa TaxID=6105 RepID=A0A6P8IZR6_ACTTE|nr:transcription factor 21-like [Actinia tenebrosa]